MKIITGADTSHVKSLINFLASSHKYEPDTQVVVYDLGLTASEKSNLIEKFPHISMKEFNFTQYPSYFNIKINAGEYAWKPVIIWNEVENEQDFVCWMDAGNLIKSKLSYLRHNLKTKGFYCSDSIENITKWTHPGMLAYFSLPKDWGSKKQNFASGYIGFNPKNSQALNLCKKWAELAQIKDCIAPEGSSRKNHRQDQALFGVLAYLSGIVNKPSRENYFWKFWPEVTVHNDVD